MREALKEIDFNIGYLRRSDKKKILEVLESEQEKQRVVSLRLGAKAASALQEVNFLALKTLDLYRTEKGFEGTDRLYSAGRELSDLLTQVEMREVFVTSMLNAFRREIRAKLEAGKEHELYLGKARSLMEGLGTDVLERFEELLKKQQIADPVQPELGVTKNANPAAT